MLKRKYETPKFNKEEHLVNLEEREKSISQFSDLILSECDTYELPVTVRLVLSNHVTNIYKLMKDMHEANLVLNDMLYSYIGAGEYDELEEMYPKFKELQNKGYIFNPLDYENE